MITGVHLTGEVSQNMIDGQLVALVIYFLKLVASRTDQRSRALRCKYSDFESAARRKPYGVVKFILLSRTYNLNDGTN